jgi:hypothetical protein
MHNGSIEAKEMNMGNAYGDGPEARIAELESEDHFEHWLELIDGAPYCQYCGAKRERDCDCGPIAENN